MNEDKTRLYARFIAIAAGVVWFSLFMISFSIRSNGITFARWGALIVLGIAWSYSNLKPRQ